MTIEDPCMAVAALLTETERRSFLDHVFRLNPHLHGADVSDVLSMMDDEDACLALVEPAYAQLKDKVSRPNLIGPAAIAVAHLHAHPGDLAEEHPARIVILISEVRRILER